MPSIVARSTALVTLAAALLLACSGDEGASAAPAAEDDAGSAPTFDAGSDRLDDAGSIAARDGGAPRDAGSNDPGACVVTLGTTAVKLGTATTADDYVLTLEVASASHTSWGEAGNEALVLDVLDGARRIGNLVLHQGATPFTYGMHLGALAAGTSITARVSPLSAAKATKSACVSVVKLAAVSTLGAAAEGVTHAPVVKWPVKKAFDDLPIVLGWSKTQKRYQLAYTNENGGTTAQCGGGAKGIRSEIARWSRALDLEGIYSYAGAGAFERCTGTVAPSPNEPRMEGEHPVVYYGDGHNRLFESRGGYGQACGSAGDAKADGDLSGWNVGNPGNDPSQDDPFTIVLRPLPVDMDAVGFAQLGGRREAIVDTYAPWLYRLTDLELHRENKIDGKSSFDMTRYLIADVYAMDVGGSGDATCGFGGASGGFVLRVNSSLGVVSDGPQMTADYFGGADNVKRIAVPLAGGVDASNITGFTFDAYDDDGIYFMALGDAFIAQPSGDNGATLTRVHTGKTDYKVYVDDDNSGCVSGFNTKNGAAYPCQGSLFAFPR